MSYFDWNQINPTDPNEKARRAAAWNEARMNMEQQAGRSAAPFSDTETAEEAEPSEAAQEPQSASEGGQTGFADGFYARKASEIHQGDYRPGLGGSVQTGTGYYGGASSYTAPTQPQQTFVRQERTAAARKKGGFARRAVALVLCLTVLALGAGFGGGYLAGSFSRTSAPVGSNSSSDGSGGTMVVSTRENTPLTVVTADNSKLLTAAEVYAQNVNSTVGITTEITTTNYWGFRSTAAAAGSGFILTDTGYILTNYHVIENANSITVAMYDNTTYSATLIGFDVSNDIAVLKIDAQGLTPVVLGDSDKLMVGEDVVAIGNPLGELTFSLTRGAVSALNRTVSLSSNVTMELIQTDCAINAGNSGGALFNLYGEVVGITNAKYSSRSSSEASIDNIGFAIPINTVRDIVTSIIEKGYVTKPYIGVTVENVSEESQRYGMPQGAAIRSVEQDSPAEKAGLQANDIVTAVDGTAITGFSDLGQIISKSEIGQKLELTVYRQGQTLTLTVTVGETIRPANE